MMSFANDTAIILKDTTLKDLRILIGKDLKEISERFSNKQLTIHYENIYCFLFKIQE